MGNLLRKQSKILLIFPDKDICERIFPRPLVQFVSNFYKQKGVEVLAGEKITGLELLSNQRVLKTSTNREIRVDGVVAGLSIEPNVEPARKMGVEMEKGIIVDEFLRTNIPDIFAAGDVAEFFNIITYHSFTQICSNWDTKPLAKWTRTWRPFLTGNNQTRKE